MAIMKDTLLHDFFLGFVRIHILYHASQGQVFGLDLMRELTQHGYRIGPGTLYPILHGLETKQFLQSEKRVVAGKVRRYYTITPRGMKALQEGKEKSHELVQEIIKEST
jgi:PadR family transcriptional regulator PadR